MKNTAKKTLNRWIFDLSLGLSALSLGVAHAAVTPDTPSWDTWRETQATTGQTFTLSWMQTGYIGQTWRLLEDGTPIFSGEPNTSGTWDDMDWSVSPPVLIGIKGSQSAEHSLSKSAPGRYAYVAELCTDATYTQCRQSSPFSIVVSAGDTTPPDGGDGGTPPQPPIGHPGQPMINYLENEHLGYFLIGQSIPVTFTKWYGTPATTWKLYADKVMVAEGTLPASNSLDAQTGSTTMVVPTPVGEGDNVVLSVDFCNDHGCTSSNDKVIRALKEAPPDGGGPGNPGERVIPERTPGFVQKSSEVYLAEERAIIDALPNKAALMRGRNSRQIYLVDGNLPQVDLSQPSTWPDNVQRAVRVMTTPERSAQENYDQLLFPIKNTYSAYGETYSFQGFVNAVATFPKFCGDEKAAGIEEDLDTLCKRSLSTMFAHNTQETGAHESDEAFGVEEWQQGLAYVNEMGCQLTGPGCGYDSSCRLDRWQGDVLACPGYGTDTRKKYFGRGAKQLSYNYNYGKFSRVFFGTEKKLLMNPDLVGEDGALALLSAFWFFMEPQPPKPSMYDMLYGFWVPTAKDIAEKRTRGFGVSTMIINGGVECGGGQEMAQSMNRIKYYRAFARFFGIDGLIENERLGCGGEDAMQAFDASADSPTSFPLYWEQNWGNKSQCELVQYEAGPFSAFYEGDYEKCVIYHNDRPHYNATKGLHPFAPVTAEQVDYPDED